MNKTGNKRRKRQGNNLGIVFLCLIAVIGSFIVYTVLRQPNFAEAQKIPPKNVQNVNGEGSNTNIINETFNNLSFAISDSGFIEKDNDEISKGHLILVNNELPFHFENGNNVNLVSIFDYKNRHYKVKDKNILLDQSVITPLNSMITDYYSKTSDNELIIVSGYRTFEFQKMLFDDRVKVVGKDEAKRWVALPGRSEHHTGLAFDFSVLSDSGEAGNFNGSGTQEWLMKDAYKYGFIVRYQAEKEDITGITNEPWHFRYVGIPHARIITEKNMCLEEYMDYLRQFSYEAPLESNGYQIYFVKTDQSKTNIPVPNNSQYSISGNNSDGFIVTISK
jgi:zinc D-Ala-D-Ala carboxypeptidase